MRGRSLVVLLVVALPALVPSACSSDDDAAPVDASSDAGADGAIPSDGGVPVFPIDPPAPPAAPALPRLTPCPDGFGAASLEHGIEACEPLPGDDGTACPPGQARFVGESGCQPIGAACPSGAFPDDAPASALFVDPSAAAGGDGTRARPFRTALEAYAAASAGTTIMLSRGDHAPLGLLPSGLSIRGACVAETRVVCGGPVAGVDVDGEVAIRDVTFDGCQAGVYVRPKTPARFHLESIVFASTSGTALNMFAGEGTGRSLVFAPGLLDETADGTGWGLGASMGVRFEASRVSFERAVEYAVLVSGEGTDVTLDDLAIRDTQPSGLTGSSGGCLTVNYGASLTVRRALLDGCRRTGATAALDATLLLEDAVVRDVQIQGIEPGLGMAIFAQSTADVSLRRVVIEDTAMGGVWANDAMTTVSVEDVVVHRADGHPTSRVSAFGAETYGGAAITGARVALYDIDGVGIFSQSAASRVAVDDLLVRDIRGETTEGQLGYGVAAYDRGTVELARARIENVRVAGLASIIDGAMVVADVSIATVRPQVATGAAACGACALEGSSIRIDRGEVVDIDGTAVGAAPVPPGLGLPMSMTGQPPSLVLSDVLVRDVRYVDREGGSGIDARRSTLSATRIDVSGVHGVAVVAAFGDTTATLSHVRVHDILAGVGGQYGYGLDLEDTTATVSDAVVERTRGVGVFVSNTDATFERLAVVDVEPDGVQGVGRALNVQGTAAVTLRDGILVGTADIGVFVHGPGTELEATGVSIVEAGTIACDLCTARGIGVGAYQSGHARLTDFLVTRSALVGVQVAGGEIDLSEGEVSSSPIGANVSTLGFDLGRLQDRVVYRDNGVNLDSSELPVPSEVAPPDIRPGGI